VNRPFKIALFAQTSTAVAIMPRTALFVVDIQNELAGDPQTEIPHAARIRAAGDKILSAARNLASSAPEGKQPALIVFVQHEERPEQGTLVNGSEPWKLVFNPHDGAKDEILVAKTTRTWKSSIYREMTAVAKECDPVNAANVSQGTHSSPTHTWRRSSKNRGLIVSSRLAFRANAVCRKHAKELCRRALE